jgi:hypothetical protein
MVNERVACGACQIHLNRIISPVSIWYAQVFRASGGGVCKKHT